MGGVGCWQGMILSVFGAINENFVFSVVASRRAKTKMDAINNNQQCCLLRMPWTKLLWETMNERARVGQR